jgi:hypothetical protein
VFDPAFAAEMKQGFALSQPRRAARPARTRVVSGEIRRAFHESTGGLPQRRRTSAEFEITDTGSLSEAVAEEEETEPGRGAQQHPSLPAPGVAAELSAMKRSYSNVDMSHLS